MADIDAQLARLVAAQRPPLAPKFVQRSKYLVEAIRAMNEGGGRITGGVGELGAKLAAQAIDQFSARRNDARLQEAQAADAQAQQDILMKYAQQAFPEDQRAQALFMMDPSSMTGAAAEAYKPMEVSKGNTVINAPGGGQFTAPTYEMSGDQAVRLGPNGFQVLGQRNPSHAEVETGRHNQVGEQQGWRGLDIQQQNANTGAFQAQTGRMSFEERKRQGGFGTPGVGGAALPPGFVLE